MDAKKSIAGAFSKAAGIPEEQALGLIETPPDKKFGDFSIPAFSLCKKGENPKEKAKQLAEKVKKPAIIEKVAIAGPYINFFLARGAIAADVIPAILKEGKKYGHSAEGKGSRVMVEYSAPNTNKPLHVGHLRNDSIGMSVSNLFEFQGYKVIRANLVNDRGIHICQAMLSLEKYGKGITPQKAGLKGDKLIGDFYVKFNQEVKENPALKEEALELLKKWEGKDPKTRKQWKEMRSWVLSGFNKTYEKYGSRFDEVFYESDFYDKAKPLIKLALEKGIFEKDGEGAIVARLKKHGLPDKIVLRPDGTSIYLTFDLALTKHKEEAFKLDKNIWCIASEQDLYLRQLFKIMELLGFKWAHNCEHLSYGLVFLPEGKMKSREGKVIDADDLIADIEKLAAAEVKKRFPKLSGKEVAKRSEAIALAAVKFAMLRIDHRKNFTFIPEQSLSFEGESGPYLLYTYARARSILRKAGDGKGKPGKAAAGKEKPDFSLLAGDAEKEIIKALAAFPETVQNSLRERAPHLLCHFLLNLAGMFNAYYHSTRVLGSREEKERLGLVEAVSTVLKSGLQLLNISVLEEM